MPLPLIFDFKANPADLNRLFSFGNTMLILLITCGIATLYKPFLKNNILIVIYLLMFCLSPISELISASIFAPPIFISKSYNKAVLEELKNVRSLGDLKIYFSKINETLMQLKTGKANKYKEEIEFLKKNSNPGDVVLSNLLEIPSHGGPYSLIPGGKYIYKDSIYSSYDSIFPTAFSTLDPYLLNELNIKWIIVEKSFKDILPKEAQDFLNNKSVFLAVHQSMKKVNETKDEEVTIYKVENIKDFQKDTLRKTGWLLVNERGQPIEPLLLRISKISMFPSSKEALLYLKNLYKINPELKKLLIIAQPVEIESLQKLVLASKLAIAIDKKF